MNLFNLPYQKADPARKDFQYLEDLSTAYWYSETLFAALSIGVFGHLEKGFSDIHALAQAASCRPAPLRRLLKALEAMALVYEHDGQWHNTQAADMHLVPGRETYMGDFLLYRQYMQPRWQSLVQKVSSNPEDIGRFVQNESYEDRNFNYVRATDSLILRKSEEIVHLMAYFHWELPVLDIGGGAGSLARALIRSKIGTHPPSPPADSVLFEIGEVIAAARVLYPGPAYWQYLKPISGDFREHELDPRDTYGLVVLGNFLHAYGHDEALALLSKALKGLRPGGVVLIHDYFPDRQGAFQQKGVLYDLNMMLNTYNGACHECAQVLAWLASAGFGHTEVMDLESDSSIIVASDNSDFKKMPGSESDTHWPRKWINAALKLGFQRAVPVNPPQISVGPWVRRKCEFGCSEYNKNLKCPPHAMSDQQTGELLSSYSRGLIIEGMPPGKRFHDKLLSIEKEAFLAGYHKALVFGAGPCPVCPECPENGVCRRPDLARPSMEACGMDVYKTARAAGIFLEPVVNKGEYVKYIGLLLLE
ncbi:MAG: hypothetical protein HKP58_20925 [Desulfatitalea sp.]|nr:hypothetical protein [Desulfatitalea sp.]NNK02882.1 hypothetical protein [Desulfatitalea sp.]